MASDPSSGPGSGVIASKQTAISSAQLKALFTTPVAVSPTPGSGQLIVPIQWVAVAANSTAFYDNPALTHIVLFQDASVSTWDVPALTSGLTSGDPSFLATEAVVLPASNLSLVTGVPVKLWCDAANLTTGTFPITFTLFYVIVPSS